MTPGYDTLMQVEFKPKQKVSLFDRLIFWYGFIAFVTVLVRALGNSNLLSLPFISDDLRYFYLAKTTPSCYIFTACIQYYFRPVVHILYWLILHSVGTDFVGVHLTFIMMHAGLAMLLAVFFRRLTGASLALVAPTVILWGVFGGYDEVYYFTSSFATELMGAWFTILTLWLFLRHLDGEGPFWIVPISLILAYSSKESSIVILPLMGLLCLWRGRLPQRWLVKLIILLIPTIGYIALEYFLQVVVGGTFRKSNLKIYYVDWHILRNLGQTLAMVGGGALWLTMPWVWQTIVCVPIYALALWLGRRQGIITLAMLLVMILPFAIKTVVLIENMTRHIYMPAMFFSLLILMAGQKAAEKWEKRLIVQGVLWLLVGLNCVSGIVWINARYQHYQPEIRLITGFLHAVNPELDREQHLIPLRGYDLIDPGLLPIMNAVYFNDQLKDLSGLLPEAAAVEATAMGYDPPRALGWEHTEGSAAGGHNVWRTLPDGNLYNGK